MGPASMEGVERTNVVMANPQQRAEFLPRYPYTMDIDRRKNRNCYVCREFGHLVKNCRNRGMRMNRRIEVEQDNNNLKWERDSIVFD